MRSLGRDIAQSLGTSAIMSALTRTAVGPFSINDAVELDDISCDDDIPARLLNASLAVTDLPRVMLDSAQQRRIANGLQIIHAVDANERNDHDSGHQSSEIAAFNLEGHLVALLKRTSDGCLRAAKNFREHNRCNRYNDSPPKVRSSRLVKNRAGRILSFISDSVKADDRISRGYGIRFAARTRRERQ